MQQTKDLSILIMDIIHHIADKNIGFSFTLDRICKKTIKMIDDMTEPQTFNF
jgi:hypothetical protein